MGRQDTNKGNMRLSEMGSKGLFFFGGGIPKGEDTLSGWAIKKIFPKGEDTLSGRVIKKIFPVQHWN